MPTLCCVPGCGRRGGHTFPRDPKIRRLWERTIRNIRGGAGDTWNKATEFTIVCYRHFSENDYMTETSVGTVPLQKRLLPGAIPHLNLGTISLTATPPTVQADERRERREKRQERIARERQDEEERVNDPATMATVEIDDGPKAQEQMEVGLNTDDLDDRESEILQMREEIEQLKKENAELRSRKTALTSKDLEYDKELCQFYTSCEDYFHFKFVLFTLGPAANELKYWNGVNPSLTIEDQFLLTLMKIRRNYTNFELSRFFDTNDKVVTSTFITWCNFMYCQWSEINWWPSRELVRYFAANDFQKKFPDARITLDATEIPIQKPERALLQSGTFSTYKNKNTLKIMVGTSPGGLVTYLSDVYGGWVSDRQIIERSNILSKCDPGDMILADKGINIEDLAIPFQLKVNIPTFFKKRNRISGATVLKDRKCSSKRCHVERHIGLAKTYKMISTNNSLKPTESKLGQEILSTCFYLTNFRKNIMPADG